MALNYKTRIGNQLLRCGITTGSCAALAASAAAYCLLTGEQPSVVKLLTPKGIPVETVPECWKETKDSVSCAVRKDAGDDPDVTNGLLIFARVWKTADGIVITGGEGIGRVTKPGLDQPVGEAAINSVPRRMIREAAQAVCAGEQYFGGLKIEISAPGGQAIAEKTFNPMLGIQGGISILGTSGIVEPMSEQALVDTIAVEARQIAESGEKRVILAPGNYAVEFLHQHLPDLAKVPLLKCSNYIGETIDIACVNSFQEVLLVGHIGKIVKLAGGIMNTHSRMADCRAELLCAHAAVCGAGTELCQKMMRQVTTEACLSLLQQEALLPNVMERLLTRIQDHLNRRAEGAFSIGAVMFSNTCGLLGSTQTAKALLGKWSGSCV